MSGLAPDEDGPDPAALYEEHPYPDHGVISGTLARMAEPLVRESAARARDRVRIIDVGCGTGEQTLGLARRFRDAEVVGVDASMTSIKRARSHASRHRLDVHFERVDLLGELPASLGRFDVITMVGVLHHLPRPLDGLTAVHRLGNRDAKLLGMVYGRHGRQATFLVRDAITAVAMSSERAARLAVAQQLRRPVLIRTSALFSEFARRRRFGPDMPVAELARRAVAGRNLAFTADTYAHSQEAAFTSQELAELLDDACWRWVGWPRRSGLPDDAADVFTGAALRRVRAMSRLEAAGIYEQIVRPSNIYFVADRLDLT